MARTNTVTITSDLTSRETTYANEADAPAKVKITLNGKSGTIDLPADELSALETLITSGDAAELRKLVSPAVTVSVGRRARQSGTRAASTSGKTASPELAKIRDWGRANGFKVSDKGRVSETLTDAYNAAHGRVSEPTVSEPTNGPASEPATADAA